MKLTVNTTINEQNVRVKVPVSMLIHAVGMVEKELIDKTQNIIIMCHDAYNFVNGHTERSIGIRMAEEIGGRERLQLVDDTYFLIAGTLRRIDNNEEIVRIGDLMKIGYQSAYVDLRGQGLGGGYLFNPKLGRRKIVDMCMVEDCLGCAYLTLAPMG